MATSSYQTAGTTCPQCLGTVRDENSERVCERCGLVVDDAPIDHGPEYRNFESSERDPRHYQQANPNRGDRGLGSERGGRATSQQESRMDTWEHRVKVKTKDQNRDYGTGEVHRIGIAVGVPRPVIERGKYLFRTVHEEGDCHSTDLDTIAPACLHVACREQQTGRTVDELVEYARTDRRSTLRRVHWVADVAGVALPPPSVPARIRVLGGKLALPEQAVRRALERFESIEDPRATSGAANTLAALCVWQATGQTQQRVADAAGCSAGGIRKRKRALTGDR